MRKRDRVYKLNEEDYLTNNSIKYSNEIRKSSYLVQKCYFHISVGIFLREDDESYIANNFTEFLNKLRD